jgi:uncharacterized membrane protein
MLEGTRLDYIVPGYAGYFLFYLDTFLTEFILILYQLKRKNQDIKFQVMQDMLTLLNQKIYMLILLENLLMIFLMETI